MSENFDFTESGEEPSRRKFLKVSAVAGAAAAATVVAGAHLLPSIASSTPKQESPSKAIKSLTSSVSNREPMIVVMNGDSVQVFHGQSKYQIKDSTVARQLSSTIQSKMVQE